MARIMEYAGYDDEAIAAYKKLLEQYRNLPDRQSSDNDVRRIRKEITARFYEIYQKAFLRSTEDLMRPSPIILMFLNFGFMDVELLGEEHTNIILWIRLDFFIRIISLRSMTGCFLSIRERRCRPAMSLI